MSEPAVPLKAYVDQATRLFERAHDALAAHHESDIGILRDEARTLVETLRRELQEAISTQKEAVSKAEVATNTRLAAMNEIKEAMSDLVATMLPRREHQTTSKDMERRIADIEKHLDTVAAQDRGATEQGAEKRSTVMVWATVGGTIVLAMSILATVLIATHAFG